MRAPVVRHCSCRGIGMSCLWRSEMNEGLVWLILLSPRLTPLSALLSAAPVLLLDSAARSSPRLPCGPLTRSVSIDRH